MTEKINKILEEIFLIDPELKKHEKDLKKVMDDLIKQKPDTKFDEVFKEELRVKLLERAEELIGMKQPKTNWFEEFFVLRNLSFAFAGAVLCLVVVVPTIVSFMGNGSKISLESMVAKNASDENLVFGSEIRNVASNAFGSLSNSHSGEVSRDGADMMLSAGRGGGGPISESAQEEAVFSKDNVSNFLDNEATESIEPLAMTSSKMIMPYNAVKYEYNYSGEEFKLNNDTLLVYKKIFTKRSGKDMSSVLKKFDLGVMNLDQFNDVKVKQISMAEEKKFGFQINVNFEAESISIYQNWNMWPRPDKDCRDEECFQSHRLKLSDIPSDKKIISIADAFIGNLGLDMNFYDKAVVQNRWKDDLNRGIEEKNIWVPEEASVIYPFKFNDQIVYDTYGNVNGLTVNINIRHMRASGVHQIAAQKYESSEYSAVTDSETVLKLIKKGGFMNNQWYGGDGAAKIVQVELGEPTLDLIRYHKYYEDRGKTEELFVPALIFPVKKLSDDNQHFDRKAITVPLIKEIIEEREGRDAIGIPELMPLLRSSAVLESE